MGKEKKYLHKMTLEFTNPNKKKFFMRATINAEHKEIQFEGEMKEMRRTLKSELPKNYHTDYREDTNKYFWYYLGRKEGGKDYTSPKYFSKYEGAVKDAMKHYNKNKN